MDRALWLLIGMQMRGWLRSARRGLTTVKGVALALISLVVFIPWLLSMLMRPDREGLDADSMRRFGPAVIAAYCFLNVFLTAGENALYFTPTEVNFLFPGPFSRRQLIGYKIVATLLVSLPSALIMAVVMHLHAGSYLAAFVGTFLVLTFMHLFSVAVHLLASAVGRQMFRRRTIIFLAVTLSALAVSLTTGWLIRPDQVWTWIAQLPETNAWHIALLPFSWFVEAFIAVRLWPDLALFTALSVLVDLSVVVVVFSIDSLNLETVAGSSARLYQRIQRMRGQATGAEAEAGGFRAVVPLLPWWGGIGPLLWRQLTSAVRQPGRLFLFTLPFCFLVIVPLFTGSRQLHETLPVLIGSIFGIAFFISGFLPYDFRGDLNRMAVLKTIPIGPLRLTFAQLLGPVLIMTVMQLLVLALLQQLAPAASAPITVAAVFLLPFNFQLFAMENLLFLLFPVRVVDANPGDFQALGKGVLFMVLRTLGLGLAAGSAALVGLLAYILAGSNQLAGLAVAWMVLAAVGISMVPLVAFAFLAFDVSRDAPA